MPDSASIPDQPSATARATTSSHASPAATRTLAPPQQSSDSTRDAGGGDPHDRAGEALVGDDEVGAAAEDEQRLVGVVDLADGVDQLVGGLDA